MSNLTDIRTTAENYAREKITTGITPPVPDVPDVINPPGEEFTFTITATNAGPPDGIAVIDVCYHLTASGAGIRLIVPPETVAIARSGPTDTSSQLTPGSLVATMYLFGITPDGIALGVSDGDAISGLKGKAGEGPGVGELRMHVHCRPDIRALFPDDRTSDTAVEPVNVL